MSRSNHPETKVGSQEWSEERFKEGIWESLPYSMSQNGVHRRRANKGKVNYQVILGIHSERRKRGKGGEKHPFWPMPHTQPRCSPNLCHVWALSPSHAVPLALTSGALHWIVCLPLPFLNCAALFANPHIHWDGLSCMYWRPVKLLTRLPPFFSFQN